MTETDERSPTEQTSDPGPFARSARDKSRPAARADGEAGGRSAEGGVVVEWLPLAAAIENEPPTLDFVLPGLLSGTVGALVGAGSAGKTMAALEAALTVAGGPDLLGLGDLVEGWNCQPGEVIYLTAEDPATILRHRLHALGARMDLDQRASVYTHLHIAPLSGRAPDILSDPWGPWLTSVAEGARLVVIDTLRRFHRLDENDGGAMADLMGRLEAVCRETGTTILYVHHVSKVAALNSASAQQASRGSSVLTDNARYQANLAPMSETEAKALAVDDRERGLYARLSFPKLNYATPIPPLWLRRQAGGLLTVSRKFDGQAQAKPKAQRAPVRG